MADRFTKVVLTVIAAALIALAVRPAIAPQVASSGPLEGLTDEDLRSALEPRKIEVPRSWGRFAEMAVLRTELLSLQFMAFEAADGTIRVQQMRIRDIVVRR